MELGDDTLNKGIDFYVVEETLEVIGYNISVIYIEVKFPANI